MTKHQMIGQHTSRTYKVKSMSTHNDAWSNPKHLVCFRYELVLTDYWML